MGSIVSKIEELLNEGNNFEIRREKYRPLTINFFDAMDGVGEEPDGCGITNNDPAATTEDRCPFKNKP